MLSPSSHNKFSGSKTKFLNFYLVILLCVAFYCVKTFAYPPNQNSSFNQSNNLVSIFDLFINLPVKVEFFKGLKALFYLTVILALIFRRSFILYIVLTFLFVFIFSIVFRSSSTLHHNTHLTAQLLIYSTLFIGISNVEIKNKNWFINDYYIEGVVAIICIFFFLAGISKLIHSGFGWVNGLALQSWVSQWGSNFFLNKLILADVKVAALFQGFAMGIEIFCVIAIFLKKSRTLIGALLCTMVAMFCLVFNFLFGHLIFLIFFSFIPWFTPIEKIFKIFNAKLYPKA